MEHECHGSLALVRALIPGGVALSALSFAPETWAQAPPTAEATAPAASSAAPPSLAPSAAAPPADVAPPGPQATATPAPPPVAEPPPATPPADAQKRRGDERQGGAGDEPAAEGFRQRTLFGDREVHHGAWGSLFVRASQVAHDPALFVGGRGGWLIDHHLLLGGGGMGQALDVRAPAATVAAHAGMRNVELGYGGFLVGYHIAPELPIHGFVSALVGGGGVALSNRETADVDQNPHDQIVVLEPEASVELNLLPFMRAQLSASYRKIWDVEMVGLDNGDLSGFAGGIGLVFGRL